MKTNNSVQSTKWRAYVLTCLAYSRAWRALRARLLGVLTCLTCFRKWRAWCDSKNWCGWRTSLNGVLGVIQKISVLSVLHKMACSACFIKWCAWRASKNWHACHAS